MPFILKGSTHVPALCALGNTARDLDTRTSAELKEVLPKPTRKSKVHEALNSMKCYWYVVQIKENSCDKKKNIMYNQEIKLM
jgi:hypothetical protein